MFPSIDHLKGCVCEVIYLHVPESTGKISRITLIYSDIRANKENSLGLA